MTLFPIMMNSVSYALLKMIANVKIATTQTKEYLILK